VLGFAFGRAMAKKLFYGKREVQKRKKLKVVKPNYQECSGYITDGVVATGEFFSIPYEITESPIKNGFTYKLSSPTVTISRAVDRLSDEKRSTIIRYICKVRECYEEYHATFDSEKFNSSQGRKVALDNALQWLKSEIGDKKATALLHSFQVQCDAYAHEVSKNNAAYDRMMTEQFGLHQTLLDSDELDPNDPVWSLDI